MDLNEPREIKNELQDFLEELYYNDNDVYLLGSASLASQRYFSDYDLFSPVDNIDVAKIIEILYKTEEHQNMYLIEIKFQKGDKKVKFKTLHELESKYDKIRDITWDFVKLDYDIYTDYKIIELSIIYDTEQEDEDLSEKLEKDIMEYKKKGQFYKALKREFSLLNYQYKKNKLNKPLEKRLLELSRFFNSKFGELYTIYSNLGAIKLMIENYDDTRSKKMVKLNLKKIGVKQENIDTVMKELEKLFNTEAKRYLDGSLVGKS